MVRDILESQLRRLVTGAVDQKVRVGVEFTYDGSALRAEEVADLMLPSLLCIADDRAQRLGLGPLGYSFEVVPSRPGELPLKAVRGARVKSFGEISPVVLDVIEREAMNCRHDMTRLFETAVRLVDAGFRLDRDASFATPAGVAAPRGDAP